MKSRTTLAVVRVKVSDGDATFRGTDGQDLDNTAQGNKWYKVPKGSRLTLCAAMYKTDSFLVEVLEPGATKTFGLALRKAGWQNLVDGSEEIVSAPDQQVDEGDGTVDVTGE